MKVNAWLANESSFMSMSQWEFMLQYYLSVWANKSSFYIDNEW